MKMMNIGLFVLLVICLIVAADKNIKLTDLTDANMNIQTQFSTGTPACSEQDVDARNSEECAELSWDNDDWAFVTWDLSAAKTSDNQDIVNVVLQRCFSKFYTKNRAWRKPKDIIRKDKQCSKIATVSVDAAQEYNYTIPSDAAEATYFFRILARCGPGTHDYCAKDDTDGEFYAVEPMDSIPGGLVAGVVVAIILAPTFLISYFIYEFTMKKQS